METHRVIWSFLLLLCLLPFIYAEEAPREKKVLSFFNVVRFPNDVCQGTNSRNGTCYTKEECESRDGTASGECADGFGVCCIISLSCGQSTSENCTYLVQTSTSSPTTQNCVYEICKAGSNVCRIRLDFTTFEIAPPVTGTAAAAVTNTQTGGAIGDCVSDTFTLTSPGNRGSPVICGINTGQHLYVDASEECAKASFGFGTATTTRQYDIKVTQYDCNTEMGGPPDCLQYHTGNTGKIASFNFDMSATATTATFTHLSNQCYDICFRRNSGNCAICFIPSITITGANAAITQTTFGLSVSPSTTIAQSAVDTSCTGDYLIIPNGNTPANAKMTLPPDGPDRFCGRVLAPATDQAVANTASVCTGRRPFRVTFKTDETEAEAQTGTPAEPNPQIHEEEGFPSGILGFSLNFAQVAC